MFTDSVGANELSFQIHGLCPWGCAGPSAQTVKDHRCGAGWSQGRAWRWVTITGKKEMRAVPQDRTIFLIMLSSKMERHYGETDLAKSGTKEEKFQRKVRVSAHIRP